MVILLNEAAAGLCRYHSECQSKAAGQACFWRAALEQCESHFPRCLLRPQGQGLHCICQHSRFPWPSLRFWWFRYRQPVLVHRAPTKHARLAEDFGPARWRPIRLRRWHYVDARVDARYRCKASPMCPTSQRQHRSHARALKTTMVFEHPVRIHLCGLRKDYRERFLGIWYFLHRLLSAELSDESRTEVGQETVLNVTSEPKVKHGLNVQNSEDQPLIGVTLMQRRPSMRPLGCPTLDMNEKQKRCLNA